MTTKPTRNQAQNVFDLADAVGAFDEWPLLPEPVDPQVALSRAPVPMPFHLAIDHDTLLVQIKGEATVAFADGPVREMEVAPGDYVYLPAGLPHRVIPRSSSLQLRFSGREAHAERASFRCEGCSAELGSTAWSSASTLRQEGFGGALDAFAEDGAGGPCPGCGTVAPAVGAAAFRWDEVARELRARGEGGEPDAGDGAEVPPPDPGRAPQKANAFWAGHLMTSQSAPMFPELGPGAMVPCVAMIYGNERPFTGRFFHCNTVDEVSFMFGANAGPLRAGTLRVGDREHVVKTHLPDPTDPEQYVFIVIVQRQSPSEPHTETFWLRCDECDAALVEREVTFVPPSGEGVPGFDTLLLAAESAAELNRNEAARTCPECDHVNPPFDVDHSGWQRYAARLRVANAAAAAARAS